MPRTHLHADDLWNCIALFRPNRPVLVTTRNRDGSTHVAPFAWCVPVSARPPLVGLALLSTPRKQHTLVNIERDGQFVVNVPGHELSADLIRSSYRYPAGVYKAGILGFDYVPSQCLNVPIVEQCRASVECRLSTSLPTGDHTLLVGEVVNASYAAQQYENGFILKAGEYPPCLHLGHTPFPEGQTHTFMLGDQLVPVSVPFSLPCPQPDSEVDVPESAQNIPERLREMAGRANPTVFATGFVCPDGPCFLTGQELIVVDWTAGIVRRVTPDGHVTDMVDTRGMPAGACVGPLHHLTVCDTGRKQVLDVSPNGTVSVVADSYEGKRLLGPNGCTYDEDGNLYFTDADGYRPLEPSGRVYVRRPDGSIKVLADNLVFPTKVAVSSDGRYLYLSETFASRVHRLTLGVGNHAGKCDVLAVLCGGIGPSGIAVGADENLYVAHFGKGVVAVLDPSGVLLAELPTGGFLPTNVVFWNGRLYVTELERGCLMCLDVVACGFARAAALPSW